MSSFLRYMGKQYWYLELEDTLHVLYSDMWDGKLTEFGFDFVTIVCLLHESESVSE